MAPLPPEDLDAEDLSPETEQDEYDNLAAKVADQLSTLSQAEESPVGVRLRYDPFEAGEVAFDTGGWLLATLALQGWLHLDGEVDSGLPQRDPIGAARMLFQMLGQGDGNECLDATVEFPRPSLAGLELLSRRLDSAVFLQAQFQELLETLPRKQATEQWAEAWSEEHGSEGEAEPIRATTDTWPIHSFADKAARGKLNLSPSYQRGDVWPTAHSQQLIISILRGIPIPSVILLKPQAEGAGGVHEVVDGKQRLTAILRFMGKHPRARDRVDDAAQLVAGIEWKRLFEENYKKFRRLWKIHMGETLTATKEAEYYFPFRLPNRFSRGALAEVQGKYYYEITEVPIQVGNTEETVRDVFESVTEYKVPLIQYIDTAPRQIHEVFHLYNRQGKHLNAEEIRNALFHQVDLMRLLLVMSGDNPEKGRLAPYLPDATHQQLDDIAKTLTGYRFGTARYRRTKLLSWLTALVLHPALQEDGKLSVRSTAKHIDELLLEIEKDLSAGRANVLGTSVGLLALVTDLHRCLSSHSSIECWAPEFQDDNEGKKWQELQLVASLLGVFLIGVLADDAADLLEANYQAIREYTASHLRPEKTQNSTQWGFIGKVSLDLVNLVGLDPDRVHDGLLDRYGMSCVPTLRAAIEHYKPRR